MTDIKKEIKNTASISISGEYAVKLSLSRTHLASAALLTRYSYNLEKEFSDSEILSQRSFVTSAVILSVSSLEGMINEFFSDIRDISVRGGNDVKENYPELYRKSNLFKYIFTEQLRIKVLDKYQIALILANKKEFEKGSNPYQDTQCLIDLRNALVHYNPSWQRIITASDYITPEKIERRLKGKFTLNPRAPRGPFFPSTCMISHGCAEWAVNTTRIFLNEFYNRIGKELWLDSELLRTK